ncbi:MAG: helix-turn-helix domain-containing protein [bacterium]
MAEEKRHPMMTVKEVAKFLRVHEITIYRMCQRRTIPCYRIGSNWRFNKAEIEKWLKENMSGEETATA